MTIIPTEAEYEQQKGMLTPPNVTLVEESGNVYYTPEIEPPHSELWDDNTKILWDDGTEIVY